MAKISVVFGLPGSGKTTLAAYLAKNGRFRNLFGLLKPRYELIYTNITDLQVPGKNIIYIDRDDIGNKAICGPRALIIYDEASQSFDNRDFKNFGKEKIKYFNEIRHHRIDDVYFFVQKYDALDNKIKAICSRVYWVRKMFLLLPYFKVWQIPHDILLAKKKDANKLNAGEIISGYVRPSFFSRLFCLRFDGSKYFKYFNSYSVQPMEPLPQCQDNEGYITAYRKTYGVDPIFTDSTLEEKQVISITDEDHQEKRSYRSRKRRA